MIHEKPRTSPVATDAQHPSLSEVLATPVTEPTDSVQDNVLEHAPKTLHMEYSPDSLVLFGDAQSATVQGVIESMQAQGKDQREVEYAVYRELEAMGIDLSTVREGAVVVLAEYTDGTREPRAMNIGTHDFGTMIRKAELHEIVEKASEYPENQQELLEVLEEQSRHTVRDLQRSLDIEESRLPAHMLADYKDQMQNILHSIYRGGVDQMVLHRFAESTYAIRSKFNQEAELRGDRVRKVQPDHLVENLGTDVNRTFDDEHVGPARRVITRLHESAQELQVSLRRSADSGAFVSGKLSGILRAIDEAESDRTGREYHLSRIKSLLQDLEQTFNDDAVTKMRVSDMLEQMPR